MVVILLVTTMDFTSYARSPVLRLVPCMAMAPAAAVKCSIFYISGCYDCAQ